MMLTAATLPLLLVLIITLHSTLTLSDHFACSWKPHNGNPGDYLYELFCEARLLRDHKEPDTKADWVCAGGDVGKVGTHIADWGHLKKNVLELGELVASVLTCSSDAYAFFNPPIEATPCAHGGYGFDEHGYCQGPSWAICKGESKEGNCYYLQGIDDCKYQGTAATAPREPSLTSSCACLPSAGEWPNEEALNDLPSVINVWFHKGRGFEKRREAHEGNV